MNKYILLRHGETEYQATGSKVLYPKEDNPTLEITQNGKERIKQVAQELSSLEIDLIFCSTYLRTKQTANIVNQELNKDIIFDARLIDTDFGIFSGKTMKEHTDYFFDKLERFSKRVPDGESWDDVLKRVSEVINEIEEKYSDKTILIISHADPLWLIAGYLKGFSKEEMISRRDKLWLDVGRYYEISRD